MTTLSMMNVMATKFGLVLDPPASFPGELHISPVEEFLWAAHDVLELTAIAHELRLSASTLIFCHMPVVIVLTTEPLFTFPVVG